MRGDHEERRLVDDGAEERVDLDVDALAFPARRVLERPDDGIDRLLDDEVALFERDAAQREAGEERWTHRQLGFSIAPPPWAAEAGWRRVDIESAALGFRDGQGSSVSLAATCTKTRASVASLARHVTIGTPRSALLAAGPYEVAGEPGWTQSFDTAEGGLALRVKAVTLTSGGCVLDWLLVARDAALFAALEPGFDAWVASFRPAAAAPEPAP